MDLKSVIQAKKNPKIPDFRAGDTIRVMARVVEGERERVQAFEGVVIRRRRGGINANFTVRRVSHGVGVERTFPLHSPRLESVKVVRVGRVRRSRLYYLRQRVGRKARIRAGSRDRFEQLARQLAEAEEIPGEEEEIAAADELEIEEEAAEGEVEEAEGEEAEEAEPKAEGAAEEPEAEAEEAAEAEVEEEEPVAEASEEAAVEEEPAEEPETEEAASEEEPAPDETPVEEAEAEEEKGSE